METNIISFFKSLPDNNNPEFTTKLSDFILKDKQDINVLERAFSKILEENDDLNISFCAYYSLMIIYRRYENTLQATILTKQYRNKFKNIPLFVFQESRLYAYYNDESNLLRALEYADTSIKLLRGVDYPGFFHNYSEIVAMLLELYQNSHMYDEDYEKKLLSKAFFYINKALELNSNYAKYYSTLSRLQTCQKDFKSAEINLTKAIQLEDKAMKDYSIRIAKYQNLILKNKMAEMQIMIDNNICILEKKYLNIENNFQKSKNSIIEFLTFFTAIITIILTGVQISLSFKFIDAASLLLVLCGTLVIVFGLMGCIIKSDKESIIKSIIFFMIGISIMVIGFIVHTYFF